MSDPKRLLHADSDADALERALLESLHDVAPSEHDKAAIWQGLSAGVVAVGIVGASSSVAASGSALNASVISGASAASGASAKLTAAGAVAASASSAVAKAMLVKLSVLIALSGAGVGAVALYRSQQPSTAPSVVPAAKQAAHASSAALRASALEAPAPAAVVELAPPEAPVVSMPDAVAETCHGKDCKNPGHPRATSAPAKRAAPDELARESALLTEARAALRAGDIPATQAALERLTRAFPRGVLTQEREVLAIELLLARDQNAEARARAARFVAEHPESPHSAKLERLLR